MFRTRKLSRGAALGRPAAHPLEVDIGQHCCAHRTEFPDMPGDDRWARSPHSRGVTR